jgi:lipopolysaccharide/colanic/teichoic acid biosynthesis glycosyltransferase
VVRENPSQPFARPLYCSCKRALDLLVALLAMGLLWPLMALIAIAIKAESAGPILVAHERVGVRLRRRRVNGASHWEQVRFTTYTFRTSQDGIETLLGHYLCSTHLNELPQLWNVLVGDLSLVGPRPALPSEVKNYSPWQLRRLETRPGMTGLWQLHEPCTLDFNEMVHLDIKYVENQSFWLDLQILGKTLSTVWQAKQSG